MPRYIESPYYPADRLFPELPKRGDYKVTVTPVDRDPSQPEEFYWHLYFKGEKVNGGLCLTEDGARQRADSYKQDHHRMLFLEKYFFDEETLEWLPRHYLNL